MVEQLREKFETQQSRYTVAMRYITQFDPEEVVKMNPQTLIDLNPEPTEGLTDFNALLKPLTVPNLSNSLKHCAAIRAISNTQGAADDLYLVLEDDVCFSETAIDQFLKTVDEIKNSDWDIVFLGFPAIKMPEDGDLNKVRIKPTSEMFKTLPGCDSYLLNKAGATKISASLLPIKFDFNVHLSFLIQKMKVNAFACTPNVFVEGSKLGTYVSSLNSNNVLIYNQVFREIFGLVQNRSTYTDFDRSNFDKLWELTPFKGHPDFMYMKGLFYMKDGKFKEAKAIFEQCFETYKKNGCAMNKETVFLNNYIELFKVVQD
jgi:hypothetical protein